MSSFHSVSGVAWSLTNSEYDVSIGEQEFSPAPQKQQRLVLKPRRFPIDRKTVFIRDLADPRVILDGPIPVTVENWEDQWTALSPDTGDFGSGSDEQSAMDEFRASIVDLYFMLKEEQHALGPLPMRHWEFLRSVIVER